ncbi:MAG TPA: TIGR01777 family oxidoreductase, partial [Candidatus Acidoferrales bacterium]
MRILVSGSTGLVGTAVCGAYRAGGHTVNALVRAGRAPSRGDVRWDYASGEFDSAAAEAADAVIHLAGHSIADGRLDEKHRQMVLESRVEGTRHLVSHLLKLKQKPGVLVAASAVGYYGDRGDEELTEQSAPGSNFLAEVAQQWEAESSRATEGGIRVVLLRFGVILSPDGGALAKMLMPFRLGLGGRVGSGRQWWPWISLPDVVKL